MEQDILLKKLSLQAESFQEGFEALTKANNFFEMINNFEHLLRTNFLTTDIRIYHLLKDKSEWKPVGLLNRTSKSDIHLLTKKNKLSIKFSDNDNFSCSIMLPLSDASYLGILLGKKMDGTRLNEFDKITLNVLLQVLDSAHKEYLNQQNEKKLIFELNEKIVQLNNLIDTGIELSRFNKLNILYELALERAASLTNSSSALLNIVDSDENIQEQITFPTGISPENILSNKLKIDHKFEQNGGKYIFVLSEKETRNGPVAFNELDKMLLQAISRQVQASIENEYLLKQSLDKERIEKELNLAVAIQQSIIPEKLPSIDGYDIAGLNIPSREVGGDYYDCIDIGDGRFAFIIADVAGKGISAALLVNTLHAALYSYLEFKLPLTVLTDKLNKIIFNSSPSDKFITFFISVLDSKTGELDIVNAGHNPILLLRKDGKLEEIEADGMGLGMFDLGIPYSGKNLILNSGDNLFLFTDGIPEAMNSNNEEYSDEKMVEFFKQKSVKPAQDFVTEFVADLKTFVGDSLQSDDITMLLLKRN